MLRVGVAHSTVWTHNHDALMHMHNTFYTHVVLQAMIDQTTLGHRLLKEQFGDGGIPKVSANVSLVLGNEFYLLCSVAFPTSCLMDNRLCVTILLST
jgi:hypothetical protein